MNRQATVTAQVMKAPETTKNKLSRIGPLCRRKPIAILLAALAGCCFAAERPETISLTDVKGRSIAVEIKEADDRTVRVIRVSDRKSFSLDRATLNPESLEKIAAWEKRQMEGVTEPHVFKYHDMEIHMDLPKGKFSSTFQGSFISIHFTGPEESSRGAAGEMSITLWRDKGSSAKKIRDGLQREYDEKKKSMTPKELAEAAKNPPFAMVDFGRFRGCKRNDKGETTYHITNRKYRLVVTLRSTDSGIVNPKNIEDVLRTLRVR